MSRGLFASLSLEALFGIDERRDPARERLAPLLSDARGRRPRYHMRLPRSARVAREGRA